MRSKRALSCFIFSLAPVLGLCGNLFSPLEMPKYDPQKARLGAKIFTDVRFSGKGRSCESCHNFYLNDSGASVRDGRVPTLINSYYFDRYLGDYNFAGFEARIAASVFGENELDASEDKILELIRKNLAYKQAFESAYGEANTANFIDALKEFLKSKTAINSKFDRFLRGEVKLNDAEYNGYVLFVRLCSACHNGVSLGTGSFTKIRPSAEEEDVPRHRLTSDGFELRRVPSLRNITQTAPYVNGQTDLRLAVRQIAKDLLKYDLSDKELDALMSFLATLKGEMTEVQDER